MDEHYEAAFQSAMERWNAHREAFDRAQQQDEWDFKQFHAAWDAGKPNVLERGVTIAVANSNLWWSSKRDHHVRYDPEKKILLIEFPDVEKFQFFKWTGAKTRASSLAPAPPVVLIYRL